MLLFVQMFVRDKGVVSAVVVRTSENQFGPANLLGFDKFRQVLKNVFFSLLKKHLLLLVCCEGYFLLPYNE
jgi:hypothetical protein